MADVPRIEVQKDAAAMLRVTPRRLRQMEKESPWWTEELKNENGYDVVGIVTAQLTHSGATNDDELKQRRVIAEVERVEFQREEAGLKVWELERQKQEALGNILPADVYQEFLRQLLGMLRHRITEIPFRVGKRASPALRKLVYVQESKIKKPSDASPLQREITKLLDELQKWLDDGSEEMKQSAG